MLQKRLNHITILHIHSESAINPDVEKLMDDFFRKIRSELLYLRCQKINLKILKMNVFLCLI